MKVVLQRVEEAAVTVDEKTVAKIGKGLLVLLGITHDDTEREAAFLAEKLVKLRIFEDTQGKMNCSLDEVSGALLIVSQFTLYGDVKKGRRPSFIEAARPEMAKELYEKFLAMLEKSGLDVQKGVFGAHMKVSLVNDGPVTLVIDTREVLPS